MWRSLDSFQLVEANPAVYILEYNEGRHVVTVMICKGLLTAICSQVDLRLLLNKIIAVKYVVVGHMRMQCLFLLCHKKLHIGYGVFSFYL